MNIYAGKGFAVDLDQVVGVETWEGGEFTIHLATDGSMCSGIRGTEKEVSAAYDAFVQAWKESSNATSECWTLLREAEEQDDLRRNVRQSND